MKAWLRLAALLTLAVSLSATPASADELSAQAPVAMVRFVGNTVADLMWYPYTGAGFQHYLVKVSGRADVPVAGQTTDFYRVEGLKVGGTYGFQVCQVLSSGTECGSVQSATMGQVQGYIRRNMTWPSGTYTLVGSVHLNEGADLTVESGCLVKSSDSSVVRYLSGRADSSDQGGYIAVKGPATFENIEIASGTLGLSMTLATMKGGGVSAGRGAGVVILEGNTFDNASITVTDPVILDADENNLTGATMTVRAEVAAQISIEGGLFAKPAGVPLQALRVESNHTQLDVSITDNDFLGSGLSIYGTSADSVAIGENRFTGIAEPVAVSLSLQQCTGIQLSRNTMTGTLDADYGVQIYGMGLPGACPVALRDNIISLPDYFSQAVQIATKAPVELTGNTLLSSQDIRVLPGSNVAAHGNCLWDDIPNLRPIGVSLDSDDVTSVVDAEGNWWGDASGPRYEGDHPDGNGADISAQPGRVAYRNWLTVDNCRVDLPRVHTVTLDLPASPPPADGSTTVPITALVRDQKGIPMGGAAVAFSVQPTVGGFSQAIATTGADGRATVQYTVPRSIDLPAGSDSVTIMAVAGGVAGTGLLPLAVERCIRVRDEAGWDLPQSEVYVNGQLEGVTDSEGKLCSYVALNDELIARWLAAEYLGAKAAHTIDSLNQWRFRAYITSMDPDADGQPAPFLVTDTKVDQVLVVKRTNPLIGFNVVAVLTWDATSAYLTQLVQGFELASKYLYDVSNGQMLFERVTIYDNGQNLAGADYQIRSSNQEWPRAHVGGIDHGAGWQVTLGRYFDGKSAGTGPWPEPDGYRTMVHEFGHYGLALYDSYFGYYGTEKRPAYCTGAEIRTNTSADANASVMDFQFNASELAMRGVSGLWSDYCQQGHQWQVYGMSDWEAVRARFTSAAVTIRAPSRVVPGPDTIPAASWSHVSVGADANTGVCTSPPTVQIVAPDGGKMVFAVDLVRGEEVVIPQGTTDEWGRIEILGGGKDDRVVFKQTWPPTDKPLTGTGALTCASPQVMGFPPPPLYLDIVIRPGAAANEVHVSVLPAQPLSTPPTVSLHQRGVPAPVAVAMSYDGGSGAYRGTGALDGSLPLVGNARVTAVSSLAVPVYYITPFAVNQVVATESATIWSADGQAELYLPAATLSADGLVSIQPISVGAVAASLEAQATKTELLPLAGPVEVTLTGASLTKGASLSLFYSEASGLAPGTDSDTMRIYRWNGSDWVPLESNVDIDHRYVAAVITEPGVYALWAEASWRTYVPLLAK